MDTSSLSVRSCTHLPAEMSLRVFVLLVAVVGVAKTHPTTPFWMSAGRSPFVIPRGMAMQVPPQFFPNRGLSFSGYFAGSGSPYGQWPATRQDVPYYLNEDGSMQVASVMNGNFEASHGYNVADSSVMMDGSGMLIPGQGASSGTSKIDSLAPVQPPEVSTTVLPDPEINTIGGASEAPTTTPTTTVTPTTASPTAEPVPESTTTTTAAPLPPVVPAASEPAGASAPPPSPPKRRTGSRSKDTTQQDDNDQSGYGNPTINAWFPFVFGGGSGSGNPSRAYGDDDTHLSPTPYGSQPRPQYNRNSNPSGHSPVAIANSFSTGRNAMSHSVATAYGSPPPNFNANQRN